MNVEEYFPFPDFRLYQQDLLKEMAKYLESYDYFFLEAPPGFGKSAVAYTIALWLANIEEFGFICVRDKFLQEQYLNDYENLQMMKGRGNFLCEENTKFTCAEGRCTVDDKFRCPYIPKRVREQNPSTGELIRLRDKHGVIFDWSGCSKKCLYWEQKDRAIRNDITILNYPYYLLELNYIHDFSKRYFGVFDEAHLIEKTLMDFISFTVSERILNRVGLEPTIPDCNDLDKWIEWLGNILGELSQTSFIDLLEKVREMKYYDQYSRAVKKLRIVEHTKQNIKRLLNKLTTDPSNWVFKIERKERNKSVVFKPVTVSDYSDMLFKHVKKKLLMSATILDHEKLKRFLGIKEEVKFLRVSKSTFPVENRPFIQAYVGKASRKTLDKFYLPMLVKTIDTHFIPKKMDVKGVIHTHTNKIAEYIIRMSKYSNIMLTNTGNKKTRESVFKEFFEAKPPKIMISPSMGLGVDLKDDRCRWQLIVKIPYPDLSDPQIAKRMEIDPKWYDWMTVMTLIQTYGRGCRSEKDYCETFITDSMFMWLFQKNLKIFPLWFREALTNRQEWESKNNGES